MGIQVYPIILNLFSISYQKKTLQDNNYQNQSWHLGNIDSNEKYAMIFCD
jgi:hypothetical protein